MATLITRGGRLYVDFRYKGKRCREATSLEDTSQNRRRLNTLLKRIEAEITLGSFEYGKYFPNSARVEEFTTHESSARMMRGDIPLFSDFAELWFSEKKIEWRDSHANTVRISLDKYLLPTFGKKMVGQIRKSDILNFRSSLAKVPGQKEKTLSPSRINHIMTPLRMIMTEAADRFEFTSPWQNIKPLKEPRTEVQPFSLEEVNLILQTVRPDFKNYFTVRFFTGMRTAEIDGLRWQNVDFERRQILVVEGWVEGQRVATKTDSSHRAIHMSKMVYEALKMQYLVTAKLGDYVFCTQSGTPLLRRNVNRRVWYPLLRHLGLAQRRPYQTRHTAATLWLASGENPEWIARQMGHNSTEMLFTVYSRYVPNLTRQDGSAFERLVTSHFSNENKGTKHE